MAKTLRTAWESGDLASYEEMAAWESYPPLLQTPHALSSRYHEHLHIAEQELKEYRLLPRRGDRQRAYKKPLAVSIYLEDLRSAHNVGSILRTAEAFGLGTVYFSPATPTNQHPKILKTAMGCERHPCREHAALSDLPRPLIALETVENAPSIHDFQFPASFTLLLGNEECGLSPDALALSDAIVEIPLFGQKNSLNVANAFAIAAAHIRYRIGS